MLPSCRKYIFTRSSLSQSLPRSERKALAQPPSNFVQRRSSLQTVGYSHGKFVVSFVEQQITLECLDHKDNLLDRNTFRKGALFCLFSSNDALSSLAFVQAFFFGPPFAQKGTSDRRILGANQAQEPLPGLCCEPFFLLFGVF